MIHARLDWVCIDNDAEQNFASQRLCEIFAERRISGCVNHNLDSANA